MKINRLILLLAIISGTMANLGAVDIRPGVSRELARQRKSTISNVVYNLSIKLDTITTANPDGQLKMVFDYIPDTNALQIDFTGKKIGNLVVNNTPVESPRLVDGHIIIDRELLVSSKNTVSLDFTADSRALNQNPGYVYTLFVPNRAHSVFPCFDQPDMKAVYNLELTLPATWKAVSNSPVVKSTVDRDSQTIKFEATEPLSTYLFAFAAGDFQYSRHEGKRHTIGAYYRETDPARLVQLDDIFSQVEQSLCMLEDYTGIGYPFAKYDIVILPGFQFGGMEHTGATFYNDNTLFLSKTATAANELARAKLIAHETSHMWFGDFVTMEWFDDVWTKEVFANYFAALITRELLPEFDHDLEWLRVYMSAALEQDRSAGSTPIRQHLDNLIDAGLVYNNIIYNKSPLMMGKLVELTGNDNFKKGIRKYLADHAYGNATWDDLTVALSANSQADLERFSRVWVYEPGMPIIKFSVDNDSLVVKQIDPRGRQIVWPQVFEVLVNDSDKSATLTVDFDGSTDVVKVGLPFKSNNHAVIIPTADGRAYGLLVTDNTNLSKLMAVSSTADGIINSLKPVGRLATLMMLNENYLTGNIATPDWIDYLIRSMEYTADSQMLSALARYVGPALIDLTPEMAAPFEKRLFDLADSHKSSPGKTLVMKQLISSARSNESIDRLYSLWQQGSSPVLSNDDFSDMSLILAIAKPNEANSIITTQRNRISNPDRLRKYDFISRAAVSDNVTLDSLFNSLAVAQNRLVEPWTLSLLSLLNHPSRHDHSVKYIVPALEMLPDIKATGDIFFPARWSETLLASYRSAEAARQVDLFLEKNKNINPLLLNKVRQGASRLMLKQY